MSAAAGSDPLAHVVQHPYPGATAEVDLGFLTPQGVITLFSDHISMILLAGVLLTLVLPPLTRQRKSADAVGRLVSSGFATFVEAVCVYLRDKVARPALGPYTDRFIKYIWSLFFFVLTLNLLGMIPLSSVTPLLGLHLGGTATANVWVTGSLAALTLLMMVVNGLRLGGIDYLKHFCPGPWWMAPLLVPIEIVGMLAKIIALTARLFANMLAGHLVLGTLVGFIAAAGAVSALQGSLVTIPVVLGSVALSFLELFVAFLQAFIFTFLTTLFIGMSVNVHHQEHHGEATAH
jgi:F-type H+-transporting ATPase subunit a